MGLLRGLSIHFPPWSCFPPKLDRTGYKLDMVPSLANSFFHVPNKFSFCMLFLTQILTFLCEILVTPYPLKRALQGPLRKLPETKSPVSPIFASLATNGTPFLQNSGAGAAFLPHTHTLAVARFGVRSYIYILGPGVGLPRGAKKGGKWPEPPVPISYRIPRIPASGICIYPLVLSQRAHTTPSAMSSS